MAIQVEQLITEHLDLWTQAQTAKSTSGRGSNNKVELTGIKKLRELILELAVRGKLVPQDPNDEPASELLNKISMEREILLEARKVKYRDTSEHPDIPKLLHELPISWSWVRFSDAIFFQEGPGIRKWQFTESGIKLLNVSNILPNGSLDLNNSDKFVSEDEFKDKYTHFKIEEGDLLFAGSGGSWGKSSWFIDPGYDVMLNTSTLRLRFFSNKFSAQYLKTYLDSESFKKQMTIQLVGIQPNFGSTHFGKVFIPIPPTNEQIRIVAKVDELMALCDQLEQQSYQQLDAHNQLVDALLATLTQSQNADELASNWQRLAAHFDTLFTTEYSIDALKQTILQLAVMGKLVKQDPNDEPASELLKRIAAEKDALVKAGKIKKQKPLPPISDEEKPFELPDGWAYERIGTFALVGTGATPARDNPAYWSPKEVNWVSSGETSQPVIFETKEKVSLLAVKETNVSIYPVGTLIVAMYGQGKTRGQITELKIEAGTNQACAAIELVEKSEWHKDFIKLFFQKSYSELRELAAGGAQPNLNVGKIADTVVPIPPLCEQKYIVEKVIQLITVCDSLMNSIDKANSQVSVLAEALVEQVVA